MSLTEIQREVATLRPEEQRRLMGYLAGLQISREEGAELRARFSDQRPQSWLLAEEVEQRLPKER